MKSSILLACVSLLALTVPVRAADDEVQTLKLQLQQMQEELAKTRQQQQQQIDALTKKLDELTSRPPSTPAEKPASTPSLEQQLAAELAASAPPPAAATAVAPAAAAAPAHAGSAYMNISYGAVMAAGWSSAADPSAQLELGDHDPIKRGFALRNAEVSVDGAVDPYFKGFANIVLKLDKNNETSIELEESYLQSTSLPANLQLKAGQYFASFGRQNPTHPHTWSFVDQPLILGRAFGPDGLRGIGLASRRASPRP